MQIEDVAGIGFTAGGTTEHERQLAIRRGLLGEVVVHAQRGLAFVVHEVLGHRATRVGGDVEHRRRIGRRGGDDDGVLQGTGLPQALYDRGDGGGLLSDGDIDADDALSLLVDNRIDGDGGFAGGAVADDELTLPAANRDHGVDGLDTGLHRLLHGLTHDDARGRRLDLAEGGAADFAESVEGPAEGVDDATDQFRSNGHFQHAGGATDFIAFLELEVIAEDDRTDVVLFEVQRHAGDDGLGFGGRELEHLAGHDLAQAIDAGNAVLHFEDGTDFLDVEIGEIRRFNFAEEDVFDFAGAQGGLGSHEAGALYAW